MALTLIAERTRSLMSLSRACDFGIAKKSRRTMKALA
jgi:hypothetical protein